MPDLATINLRFQQLQSKDPGWVDRITISNRNKMASEFRKAYQTVVGTLGELYARLGELSYAEMVKFNRLNRLSRNIYNEIKAMDGVVTQIIYSDIQMEYSEQYYRRGYSFESSLESSIDFTKLTPDAIKYSLQKKYDFSTIKNTLALHRGRIYNSVKHNLNQGLIQGYGYGEMAKEVKESFNRGFSDAYRIMRTEGHRAREIGNLDALEHARNKGVITKDYWVAVFDQRTRVEHGDMDGREREKDGLFHMPGGVTTEAPGLSGVARHDINCRCHVATKIINFSPKYKRVKGIGIVSKTTAYKEWKNIKKIKGAT